MGSGISRQTWKRYIELVAKSGNGIWNLSPNLETVVLSGPCIKIPSGPFFGPGILVSGTAVTHVEAPVAWGPRIIDTVDTAVAMTLDVVVFVVSFPHGTGGEENILQPPALMISATTTHKIFGPFDLTSTYSVCTRRVFGGIENSTQAFGLESDVLTTRLSKASTLLVQPWNGSHIRRLTVSAKVKMLSH
ncbi:hypothetical protein TNCV_3526441 [Trichonephila clavipes]|nr:hypothetical protein TNCV_3526441 [Trichonephila clavipes]